MGAAPGHVPFAPPVAFVRVPHMALLSRILPRIEQLEGRSCKEGLPVSRSLEPSGHQQASVSWSPPPERKDQELGLMENSALSKGIRTVVASSGKDQTSSYTSSSVPKYLPAAVPTILTQIAFSDATVTIRLP